MNIHEMMTALNSGPPVERRLVVEIDGKVSNALFIRTDHPTRLGSVVLSDDWQVTYVLLTDTAPVWVLRRLELHGITVK